MSPYYASLNKSTQTQRNVMGNGEMKFPVKKGRQADMETSCRMR